jgi:hypothetical protein
MPCGSMVGRTYVSSRFPSPNVERDRSRSSLRGVAFVEGCVHDDPGVKQDVEELTRAHSTFVVGRAEYSIRRAC